MCQFDSGRKNLHRLLGMLVLGLLCWCSSSGQKRIYISPDDHTDYLWTADEVTYRQAFIEMIDYYLHLADSTEGFESAYQSRWSCDGSHWMWTYEQNRTPSEFLRLIDRIRSGHISVPLTALVSCYGGTPAEAVIRGMYYAGRMERKHNLRFTMAVAMENQTLPYGLGSLWAGSGARYSWRGICGCATQVPSAGSREHDMYWWEGTDGSRILMKWNSFFGNASLGGYAEARDPGSAVDLASGYCNSPGYPYQAIGVFGAGWDDLKTFTPSFLDVARTKTHAGQQVIVSNEEDFFRDFDSTYGATLPVVSSTFGNEWELYCASLAEVSASVKRSVEKLRNAEALATLVSLASPGFMSGRDIPRDSACVALGLYWEHDWTADGPVSRSAREAWQRKMAGAVESYVNTLHSDASSAMGTLIRSSGSNQRFFVFNSLGWTRNDVADVPYDGPDTIHVIDVETNAEVPAQIVVVDARRYLRIAARSVPATGYRVYEIRPGPGEHFADAGSVTGGGILENSYYRITVSPRGAITGLIDRTRGDREFAATVGGKGINDLGSGSGTLAVENAGPVSVTLLATSASPLQHTSRITVYRDTRRIDIRNDINQNFGGITTWSFSLNIGSPEVWHEEVGAIIRARLQSQGGHYSDRAVNSRYDWQTMNHFADMSGGGVGLTISNADCYFMKIGNSTSGSLDITTPQINVLAGGQVDGTGLGILNQGGDSHFLQRFALQTHDAFDEGEAMRMSLEHQNPLLAAPVTGGSVYPESTFSLLSAGDSGAILWALKPAEEGIANGVIARIWNVSRNPLTTGLTASGSIMEARRTTHIETDLENDQLSGGDVLLSFQPGQIQTHRLFLGGPSQNEPPRVTLLEPLPGTTYVEPATVALAAAASDTDGTVAGVGFYRDGILLEIDSTAPFGIVWTGVPAGEYVVTARAFDNGGAFSSIDSAVIRVFACQGGIPLAPLLLSPADDTTGLPLNPRFRWSRSDCALRFHLQLATDSGFATLADERTALMDTTIQLSGLSGGAEYFWRVRSWNDGDTGVWSVTRKFTTQSGTSRVVAFEQRWNLLSIPVKSSVSSAVELFPEASGPAYLFAGDTGYQGADSLFPGSGYWLKFPIAGSVEMTGEAIDHDSVDVRAGWNLIGSISDPVFAASVGSSPSGITTSQFYEYEAGYRIVDTLVPGRGYWVRVESPCKLIFGSPARGLSAQRITIVPTSDPPPAPPGDLLQAGRDGIPAAFSLERCYPNPFNPVTNISYVLPWRSYVTLRVFTTLGQVIATPVNGIQEEGAHTVRFDGSSLSNGVYLYRLDAVASGNPGRVNSAIQKMVLLK
jgi:alpha-mannosidase